MSSFFTTPASQRKRKRPDDRTTKPFKKRGVERGGSGVQNGRASEREVLKKPREPERDESISGSDSEEDAQIQSGSESEATSEEDEPAADRRVRLAQRYLDNIRQEVDEAGFDAEEIDKDLIAQRLKEDADEVKGRQFRLIASTLDFRNVDHTLFRANTDTTTAIAVRSPYAYTVSKDRTLIKWQLMTPKQPGHLRDNSGKKAAPPKKRPKQVAQVRGIRINASAPQQHGHTDHILSLAVSPDGKYVATGGADKKLIIWSAADLRPLKTFTTHRDAVTGLDFAPSQSGFGTQLFSASKDRSIKTYNLAGEDSLAYVETLFGHQDHVLDVSAMTIDQCVSVGARDRSARLWKVVDETQLKFLGDSSRHEIYKTGSLDCVAALSSQLFVTGSDSGAICLWSMFKKKAQFTIQTAHGVDEPPPLEDVTSESDPKIIEELKRVDGRRPIPRAVTAIAAIPGTDVVLSGSWDGWIRAWKLSDDKRTLISLGCVGDTSQSQAFTNGHVNGGEDAEVPPASHEKAVGPVKGVVNSIAVLERRKEIVNEFGGKKEGECLGLCILAATGKELKLGRWMKFPKGKNGAVVFEVPLRSTNGISEASV